MKRLAWLPEFVLLVLLAACTPVPVATPTHIATSLTPPATAATPSVFSPPATATPPAPTATLTLTPTRTPTPTITPTPTATSTPTPTPTPTPTLPPALAQPPSGTFLFVERISDITPQNRLALHFPAYTVQDGILQGVDRPLPALQPGDIGYYGGQVRLAPPGEGGAGVIAIIRKLPLDDLQGDLHILSLHQDGGVLIQYNGKNIFVAAGQTIQLSDRQDTGVEGDLVPGPRHVVETFVNHGFVPRDKVLAQ